MREGLVIIPQQDNAGHSLKQLRDKAALKLTQSFGGVTIRNAEGLWSDNAGKLYNEPVWELVTAYNPSHANNAVLRDLADTIGHEGKQKAVYVRYANGDVEVRDTGAALAA
jgi:hypothetical protein